MIYIHGKFQRTNILKEFLANYLFMAILYFMANNKVKKFIYILWLFHRGQIPRVNIYRVWKYSMCYILCYWKGRFPGKRVFFLSIHILENGAWKPFGDSVINKIWRKLVKLSVMHAFIKHKKHFTLCKVADHSFLWNLLGWHGLSN